MGRVQYVIAGLAVSCAIPLRSLLTSGWSCVPPDLGLTPDTGT
jgi:hypothetical protein